MKTLPGFNNAASGPALRGVFRTLSFLIKPFKSGQGINLRIRAVAACIALAAASAPCLHGGPARSPEQDAAAIILPRVQFTGASLDEAVGFLRAKARQLSADHAGINIVIYARAPQARFTFDLHDVSVMQVLQQIAGHAGLELRFANGAAILDEPASAGSAAAAMAAAASPLTAKAAGMVLPVVQFTEASLPQAVEFLRAKSRDQMPDRKPLNVTLQGNAGADLQAITLSLQNVTLLDALVHCAAIAGHEVTENSADIVLVPAAP